MKKIAWSERARTDHWSGSYFSVTSFATSSE